MRTQKEEKKMVLYMKGRDDRVATNAKLLDIK